MRVDELVTFINLRTENVTSRVMTDLLLIKSPDLIKYDYRGDFIDSHFPLQTTEKEFCF